MEGGVGLGVVGGPFRQPLAVRVAGGRHVDPVGGEDVRQPPVGVAVVAVGVGVGADPEVVEHVGNLGRVVRAVAVGVGRGRDPAEEVQVGRRRDRLHHAGPGAHLPAEGGVGAARHAGLLRLLVGRGREGLEQRVGVLAVLAPYRLAVLLDGLGPRRAAEHRHLVGVRADDDRHVVLPPRREDVVDGVGEDPAVDVRGRPHQVGRHALHRVRARGPHRLGRRRRAVAEQGLDEALAGRLDLGPGRRPAPRAEAAAALADGGVEEAARERGRHQLVDAPRAGRLAEDGHARRVAAERRDVPLHPAEGGDLVEEAVVARRPVPGLGAQQRVGEIAERSQAVVDGDQHHAPLGQPRAVVGDVGAVADRQPAAVDPDEHRGAVVRPRRRPDVQVEAVLVHAVDARVVERAHRGGQRVLHARRRRLGRVAHALPGRRRLGGTPPQIAHRRCRERHAPVDHDLVAERRRRSRKLPALDGHDGTGGLAGGGRRAGAQETDEDQHETDCEQAAHHVSDHGITSESSCVKDSTAASGSPERRRHVPGV